MSQFTCPTCHKRFDSVASRSLPFCSPRCRQIDLGRWLSEENRLPVDPGSEVDDDSPHALHSLDEDE